MAWTLYRVQQHRKKMQVLDERAVEIGSMAREDKRTSLPGGEDAPTLPDDQLLVVLYRNKKRPWRAALKERIERGEKVLVISTRPPREMRKLYPGIKRIIWLNRSTAHELEDDIVLVNPTNLSSLLEEIRSYMGRSRKKGAIAFEGFEDIISSNETARVIRFLNMLKQSCGENSISAIVPLAYRAVPQRTRNQLMEGFESVVIG
jgi:hypothetical protein